MVSMDENITPKLEEEPFMNDDYDAQMQGLHNSPMLSHQISVAENRMYNKYSHSKQEAADFLLHSLTQLEKTYENGEASCHF